MVKTSVSFYFLRWVVSSPIIPHLFLVITTSTRIFKNFKNDCTNMYWNLVTSFNMFMCGQVSFANLQNTYSKWWLTGNNKVYHNLWKRFTKKSSWRRTTTKWYQNTNAKFVCGLLKTDIRSITLLTNLSFTWNDFKIHLRKYFFVLKFFSNNYSFISIQLYRSCRLNVKDTR